MQSRSLSIIKWERIPALCMPRANPPAPQNSSMEDKLVLGADRTFHGFSDDADFEVTRLISSREKSRSPCSPICAFIKPFLCHLRIVSGETSNNSAAE